jgi:ferric-dicitrate binding protein FerR (iron transport regulator)
MKNDHSIGTYEGYGVTDFLTDYDFQEWVKKDHPQDREFWERFMYAYPHKEKEVREAYSLLSRLKFIEPSPDQKRYQRIWDAIQSDVEVPQTVVRRMPLTKVWISVAASVLIVFSLGMWWLNSRSITIKTGRADVRELVLADQSTVMLNANSSLTYHRNFNRTSERELWLKGEGYFNVSHLTTGASGSPRPFIVHTPDLDLVVLGTAFNVKVRRSVTNVMLTHGSVLARFRDKQYRAQLLKPGEMLEFTPGKAPILHKAVDSSGISSWRKKRFVFSNTPLNLAIQEIEDYYDCTITVKDAALLNYRITATVTAPPMQELEKALSGVLNMKVSKNGDVFEIVSTQQ